MEFSTEKLNNALAMTTGLDIYCIVLGAFLVIPHFVQFTHHAWAYLLIVSGVNLRYLAHNGFLGLCRCDS